MGGSFAKRKHSAGFGPKLNVSPTSTRFGALATDKVYVVLDRQCRFTVGSEVRDGGPGTAVLAPAGVDHGVENALTMDARLLVMMTPPPEH